MTLAPERHRGRSLQSRALSLLLAATIGLLPAICHAQAVDLPRAMTASTVFGEVSPLPAVGDDYPRVALAPYGYGSGYPAGIAESADAATRLPRRMSPSIDGQNYGGQNYNGQVFSSPMYDGQIIDGPIIDGQIINGPTPGTPVFAAPGFAPGTYQPFVTDEGVIIPGEVPLVIEQEQKLASQGSPSGRRKGFVQQVSSMTTYLPRFGDDGLGQIDFENMIMVGMPFPTRETPLVISPGFDFHLIDGPEQTDLPPRLYDLYVGFRWFAKVSDRWSVTLAATPGYYTDYENDTSDAFRITGQALAIWEWRPESRFIFGVVYLDRDDIGILPAAGVIWQPNEETRLDLIFPRPRLLRRFRKGSFFEDWWFLAGEFGGGQWAIERASGEEDVVSISDYRVSAGLERKSKDYFFGGRIEVGYVFGRSIEYRSHVGDFDPSDTMFARIGLFY